MSQPKVETDDGWGDGDGTKDAKGRMQAAKKRSATFAFPPKQALAVALEAAAAKKAEKADDEKGKSAAGSANSAQPSNAAFGAAAAALNAKLGKQLSTRDLPKQVQASMKQAEKAENSKPHSGPKLVVPSEDDLKLIKTKNAEKAQAALAVAAAERMGSGAASAAGSVPQTPSSKGRMSSAIPNLFSKPAVPPPTGSIAATGGTTTAAPTIATTTGTTTVPVVVSTGTTESGAPAATAVVSGGTGPNVINVNVTVNVTSPEPPKPEGPAYLKLATGQGQNKYKCAVEIATTEKSYIDALTMLSTHWIGPMQARLKVYQESKKKDDLVLSAEEINLLFGNIELIASLNRKFLSDLEERLNFWVGKEPSEQFLGDVLMTFAPYFKMYSAYCATYDMGIKFYEKLCGEKREQFTKFANDATQKCKGHPLNSFLIMPIQRVPRYKLLLEELIKRTEPSHPDVKELKEALGKISDSALHINEFIKRRQNSEQMLMLEAQFVSNPGFISQGRTYIRHGPMIKKCRSSDKRYEFFLFNNMLAYATQVLGKYKLHHKMDIDGTFSVEDMADNENATAGTSHRMCIRTSQKSFVVFCKDASEKTSWLQDFNNCVEKFRNTVQGKSDKPVEAKVAPLLDVSEATRCNICESPFTFFVRRQHCRACDNAVCNSCSKSRMALRGMVTENGVEDKTPQRVCDSCVKSQNFSAHAKYSHSHHKPKSASVMSVDLALPSGAVGGDDNGPDSARSSRSLEDNDGSATPRAPSRSLTVKTDLVSGTFSAPSTPSHTDLAALAGLVSPTAAAAASAGSQVPGMPSTPINTWSVQDVLTWLASEAMGFAAYVNVFKEFRIDGQLLLELTDEDLSKDMKIPERIQRRRLLNAIAALAPGAVIRTTPAMTPKTPGQGMTSSLSMNSLFVIPEERGKKLKAGESKAGEGSGSSASADKTPEKPETSTTSDPSNKPLSTAQGSPALPPTRPISTSVGAMPPVVINISPPPEQSGKKDAGSVTAGNTPTKDAASAAVPESPAGSQGQGQGQGPASPAPNSPGTGTSPQTPGSSSSSAGGELGRTPAKSASGAPLPKFTPIPKHTMPPPLPPYPGASKSGGSTTLPVSPNSGATPPVLPRAGSNSVGGPPPLPSNPAGLGPSSDASPSPSGTEQPKKLPPLPPGPPPAKKN